jgi:D-lactate dehydrogenase
MKLAVFSAKSYDRKFLDAALKASQHSSSSVSIIYHDLALSVETVPLVKDVQAVCVFVNDTLDGPVLEALHDAGVRAILLRCAGYNNVDLKTAESLGMFVANVPSYSPEAVAEFALALVQTLNRNTHRAYNRTREGNFSLEGLLGKTLCGKTVGVIGTGRIGVAFARIIKGFGCTVYAYDPYQTDAFKQYGEYLSLEELLPKCDIISLHCPLMDSTKHIINHSTLKQTKKGAIIVNTSRGGLLDTKAVIDSLKSRHLGGLAIDVYEQESGLFYDDHSAHIIDDDVFSRLMTFPNVLVTGHQGFFTEEALQEIAECTLRNLVEFAEGRECKNSLVKRKDKEEEKKQQQPVRNV